ncbi:MAG TPA: HAD-IC family P-type ATPase [bacterium]|nr:HAD-IC family P-type ATPase [bacterium]HPN67278.1 HAD-IC family P-type ATPase [bacterium]
MNYHSLSVEKSIEKLQTDVSNGLTAAECQIRQQKYGYNLSFSRKTAGFLKIILNQLSNYSNILLIVVGLISVYAQRRYDFIIIFFVLIIKTVAAIIKEYHFSQVIKQLNEYSQTLSRVIRDHQEQKVPVQDLVPGDIIFISAGIKIPADARVVIGEQLFVNQSMLTGEISDIPKFSRALMEEIPLIERNNMLYQGSYVTQGSGIAVVTNTGGNTEFNKIFISGIKNAPAQIKLHGRLQNFSSLLVMLSAVFLFVFVFAGWIMNKNMFDVILLAIAVCISAISITDSQTITMSLIMTIKRLAGKKVIIKNLSSIENLDRTSVICMDKTGTLTNNQPVVKKIITADNLEYQIDNADYSPIGDFFLANKKVNPIKNSNLELILTAGTLCNNSSIKKIDDSNWIPIGETSEAALIATAAKAALDPDLLHDKYRRDFLLPPSSDHDFMTTVNSSQVDEKRFIFIKGSPEHVLGACSYKINGDKTLKLSLKEKKDILLDIDELAAKSYQIIAIAYKEISFSGSFTFDDSSLKYGVVFLGFFVLQDPLRSGSLETIRDALQLGLKISLITDDHPKTAINIFKSLGMKITEDNLITNENFHLINNAVNNVMNDMQIFAGLTPEYKKIIVEYYQQAGNSVIYIGSKTSDVISMQKADVKIALSHSIDAIKDSADIVLLENNFSGIIEAVKESKIAFSNIKQNILFSLELNVGLIGMICLSLIMGASYPLSIIQIIWLSVIVFYFIGESFLFNDIYLDISKKNIRSTADKIFDSISIRKAIINCAVITLSSFLIYKYFLTNNSIFFAHGMVFLSLSVFAIFDAISRQLPSINFFKYRLPSRNVLFLASVLLLAIQLLIVFVPQLSKIFQVSAINIINCLELFGAGLILFIIFEIEKYFDNHFLSKAK